MQARSGRANPLYGGNEQVRPACAGWSSTWLTGRKSDIAGFLGQARLPLQRLPAAFHGLPFSPSQGREHPDHRTMRVLDAVAPVLSSTSTVNEKLPALVGVPVTLASGLFSRVFLLKRVSSGSLPEATLNFEGGGPRRITGDNGSKVCLSHRRIGQRRGGQEGQAFRFGHRRSNAAGRRREVLPAPSNAATA